MIGSGNKRQTVLNVSASARERWRIRQACREKLYTFHTLSIASNAERVSEMTSSYYSTARSGAVRWVMWKKRFFSHIIASRFPWTHSFDNHAERPRKETWLFSRSCRVSIMIRYLGTLFILQLLQLYVKEFVRSLEFAIGISKILSSHLDLLREERACREPVKIPIFIRLQGCFVFI